MAERPDGPAHRANGRKRTLGIAGVLHDATVALVEDGRVVCAIEEERLSRVKNASVFPQLALARVLEEGRLTLSDIDAIGFYWDPRPDVAWAMRLLRRDAVRLPLATLSLVASMQAANVHIYGVFSQYLAHFAATRRQKLPPVRYLPHHECHAAAAFSSGPFEHAAILVADAMGEVSCTTTFEAHPGVLRPLSSIEMPHSLGLLYAAITQHLGFEPVSDEWKVMGLASYGERDARLDAFFAEIVRLLPRGRYVIDRRYTEWHRNPRLFHRLLSVAAEEHLGPPRTPDEPITDRHRAIARAVQARVEEAVFHVLRELHRVTGVTDLCLAGGVALNCVANGRIREQTPFQRVFVPYAPGDAGAALGAGLLAAGAPVAPHQNPSPYLGPAYSEELIGRELERCHLVPTRPQDISREVARLIAAGGIVGWFQGAMELGPRALGHRSILADPRRPEIKDRINAAVKYREAFRPFAPAVLEERADEYFDAVQPSPYMSFALHVRSPAIPGATHVDGTGRLQTVSREMSPGFHQLISAFADETGIPVLVNTSFNVKGEPIVCAPLDAVRCFSATGLDHLAIGPFLLSKRG